MKSQLAAACLIGLVAGGAMAEPGVWPLAVVLAQAMMPPTGMGDADKPMPMTERMNRRFAQPVRVGDLIGLPMLDMGSSTLGRPVAVPIEAVGIEGRQLVSLDMARNEYAAAPTWQDAGAKVLPGDATVRIALARNQVITTL
jgi:hypothetical protein